MPPTPGSTAPGLRVALLEPAVASECVVTELMGQIRCGAPFLAGALTDAGHVVRVFAEELVEFDARLLDAIAAEFDVVGISMALNTLARGCQVAAQLRRRRPTLLLVAGGPSAINFAERMLPPFDAVLGGRAEVTLPSLLAHWQAGGMIGRESSCSRAADGVSAPADIPHLAWRGSDGRVCRSGPARAGHPVADHRTRYDLVEGFGPMTVRDGLFGGPKPAIYSLFASTGCVRHCRFCQSERSYRQRPIESVITDLQTLLRLHAGHGVAHFMLCDDCLFADLEVTKELLRRIAHACKGHRVSFAAQFHVQPTSDDELMGLFRQAGFASLAIGFETVSGRTLDAERKGTVPADNDLAIEQCRRHGIVPYGYFVVGFDTDTEDTVRGVFDYIVKRRLVAQVLPVGLMSRDLGGRPTADAPRIFSDTSFGATVFVSHRPAGIAPARLQHLINEGTERIAGLWRWGRLPTAYERRYLLGLDRCLRVWLPRMRAHVDHLRILERTERGQDGTQAHSTTVQNRNGAASGLAGPTAAV